MGEERQSMRQAADQSDCKAENSHGDSIGIHGFSKRLLSHASLLEIIEWVSAT